MPSSSNSDVVKYGVAWFMTSALLSTYANTAFLQTFDSPWDLLLIRVIGSTLIGFTTNLLRSPSHKSNDRLNFRKYIAITKAFAPTALCLFIANYFNGMALKLSGITLTYVVKATIPVFTVLYAALVKRETFSAGVYMSIVPTVCGVAVAAWSDSDFTVGGLMAALASTLGQTAMNLSSKHAMASTHASGIHAQFAMVSLLCGALGTVHILGLMNGHTQLLTVDTREKFGIVLVTGVAYHIEYVLNFIFTATVSTVSFSVADIARRLAIIITGAVLFGKVLAPMNLLGVAVALSGVLSYSLILNLQQQKQKKKNVKDAKTP